MNPTTMKQIAAACGTSRTTVSLVLKGDGDRYRISRRTQQRVLTMVREAGFRPNYVARALSTKRTRTVGVVFPDLFETFMTAMLRGIEDVLYPADYGMLVCSSRFDPGVERRNIEQLMHRGVDGFIVAHTAVFRGAPYHGDHLTRLAGSDTPVVFVDRVPPSVEAPAVVEDDENAAYRATRSLLAQGCRRIALVSFDIDVSTIRDRLAGVRRALGEQGLRVRPGDRIMLDRQDDNAGDLQSALRRLFGAAGRPDGIVITTNGLALKTAHILGSMGLVVNRDFRAAYFGSEQPYFPSGMTCVSQRHREMGEKAAQLLVDTLHGRTEATGARRILVSDPPLSAPAGPAAAAAGGRAPARAAKRVS